MTLVSFDDLIDQHLDEIDKLRRAVVALGSRDGAVLQALAGGQPMPARWRPPPGPQDGASDPSGGYYRVAFLTARRARPTVFSVFPLSCSPAPRTSVPDVRCRFPRPS